MATDDHRSTWDPPPDGWPTFDSEGKRVKEERSSVPDLMAALEASLAATREWLARRPVDPEPDPE